jgi:hypothetical protein
MTQSREELLAEDNRRLKAEVGRLGIGCRHLLSCFDYAQESEAPLSELDPADRALIEETRRQP